MVWLHEPQHFTGQHYSESIQCRYAMSKHSSLMDELSSRWRFDPLSKKGRSAVWLAWIGCGLHILQISTAASTYRRFLIDTLDSSLRCQHQYTQWQKIFWNNQCLGALKQFCYHFVKWHFQPLLACDLLQKSNKKHYSYSFSKEQPSSIKIFQVILLKYPLSHVSEEIPVWVSSLSPSSFDLSQTWQVYC